MRLPTIGATVLYKSPGLLKQVPAIIMAVDDRDPANIKLNLTVFDGRGVMSGTVLMSALGVAQGDNVGQWQWPDMPALAQ